MRCSKSCTLSGRSSCRRCTNKCSRQTCTASARCSFGTFKRLQTASTAGTPKCSWAICFGHAVLSVNALPRSCTSATKPIRSSPGAKRAAISQTISVWMPASTSGWYSMRCGTPYKAFTSGKRLSSACACRNVCRNADGVFERKAFVNSCQTRSATKCFNSPACTMLCISKIVSSAMRKPKWAKRAINRAPRNTRNGSSLNAADTCRIMRSSKSRWPWWGSIICPCSSCAMALIVKSRRAKSCSSVTDGSA